MIALWYLIIPVLSVVCGYFPARRLQIGEDLPKKVALQWARWGRHPDYIASESVLAARFSSFQGPVLAYSFSDDNFAPIKAVNALLTCYTRASIEHRHKKIEKDSQSIGHFGFFRENVAKDNLWKESVDWLNLNLW